MGHSHTSVLRLNRYRLAYNSVAGLWSSQLQSTPTPLAPSSACSTQSFPREDPWNPSVCLETWPAKWLHAQKNLTNFFKQLSINPSYCVPWLMTQSSNLCIIVNARHFSAKNCKPIILFEFPYVLVASFIFCLLVQNCCLSFVVVYSQCRCMWLCYVKLYYLSNYQCVFSPRGICTCACVYIVVCVCVL